MNIGGNMVSMAVVWLIATVVFLIIEGIVPGLISIWFAAGALAALLAAMVGAPIWLQVVWFLLVSIAALAITRPLVKKSVNGRTQPTNADRIFGKECVVREAIDNVQGTGAVAVDGKVWTARMESDEESAQVGEIVVARRIEGVKLIVGKKEQEPSTIEKENYYALCHCHSGAADPGHPDPQHPRCPAGQGLRH